MEAKTVLEKMNMKKFVITAVAGCFLLAAPQVWAQNYEQQQQQQQQEYQQQQNYQQQESQPDFSYNDLEKFADAQAEVDEIRSEFSKELEGVEETDKARELQDKYSQKMVESIAEKDLSVRKYNEISMAMQSDPDVRKKVEELRNK